MRVEDRIRRKQEGCQAKFGVRGEVGRNEWAARTMRWQQGLMGRVEKRKTGPQVCWRVTM